MIEVENYTLNEFVMLPEEMQSDYVTIGLALNGDNWTDEDDITQWPWGRIKEIQSELINDLGLETIVNIINISTDIDKEDIMKKGWYEVFRFFNWIMKSLDIISNLEKQLAYEPSGDELRAGIEEYNQFGYFVTIDRLAQGDPLRYEDITKQPFNIIFSKLLLNGVDYNFQSAYSKIMMNKK